VTHDREGLLVPVRDAGALANAIERLFLDRALCARLGEAARRKALAEFDDSLVIARTLRVYEELLPIPFQPPCASPLAQTRHP
jgi:glycosyltransferase involved in cell wall biosynthesis